MKRGQRIGGKGKGRGGEESRGQRKQGKLRVTKIKENFILFEA